MVCRHKQPGGKFPQKAGFQIFLLKQLLVIGLIDRLTAHDTQIKFLGGDQANHIF